jgi:hypothetical protein
MHLDNGISNAELTFLTPDISWHLAAVSAGRKIPTGIAKTTRLALKNTDR